MNTDDLRELAKRATQGPWKVCDANMPESAGIGVRTLNDGTGDGGYIICDLCADTDYDQQANAEYIAALSPDVLEGLCDRIDEQNDIIQRQQGAVFAAGMALVPGGSGIEFRNVRAEQSEAERDALRAENERLRDALRMADAYFSQIVGPDETPRKEIRALLVGPALDADTADRRALKEICVLAMQISQRAYPISMPENQPGTKMAVPKRLITDLVNLTCNSCANTREAQNAKE
jgi:hypothetical protein